MWGGGGGAYSARWLSLTISSSVYAPNKSFVRTRGGQELGEVWKPPADFCAHLMRAPVVSLSFRLILPPPPPDKKKFLLPHDPTPSPNSQMPRSPLQQIAIYLKSTIITHDNTHTHTHTQVREVDRRLNSSLTELRERHHDGDEVGPSDAEGGIGGAGGGSQIRAKTRSSTASVRTRHDWFIEKSGRVQPLREHIFAVRG